MSDLHNIYKEMIHLDDFKEKLVKKFNDLPNVPEEITTIRFGWDSPKYQVLETPAKAVMRSYQNANKWLDTIKEHLYIYNKCPFFSNIVHQLAHKMPGRFDSFGDILHARGLEIPYPETAEWKNPNSDLNGVFNSIFEILDSIETEIIAFKKIAEESNNPIMSISCDPLLTDIDSDYEFFIKAQEMLESYGSNISQWDKSVYNYYKEKSNLI